MLVYEEYSWIYDIAGDVVVVKNFYRESFNEACYF